MLPGNAYCYSFVVTVKIAKNICKNSTVLFFFVKPNISRTGKRQIL